MSSSYLSINTGQMSQNALSNFSSEVIDYLYDLEPASNNLFWAGNFSSYPDADDEKFKKKLFENAQFRIESVSLSLPTFDFTEVDQMHVHVLSKIDDCKEVTLKWKEDVWRSVQKYHLDWQNRWYDRQNDCLRCGALNKYRGLDVFLFHYIDSNDAYESGVSAPTAEAICQLKIRGLAPKNIGNISLNWGSSGNDSTLDMTYSVNRIQWIFNENLIGSISDYNAASVEQDNDATIWKPYGATVEDDSKKSSEAIRLQQTLISTLVSEGMIT